MRVAVVGGSIAGCSAAILFQRAGHRVQIYERTAGALAGRGGGIGTPERVVQSLVQYDVLDEDFPHCVSTSMPFVVRTPEHPRLGHRPWAAPSDFATFHWSALWRQLRKRVPDEYYRSGCEVKHTVERPDGKVELRLSDGSAPEFDLVIFADGHRSLGRRQLFPDAALQYRGYASWRGIVPESALEEAASGASGLMGDCTARVMFPGMPGHLVVFRLPSPKGSTEPGDRLVDWAAYLSIPEDDVESFMTDRRGRVREGAMPPGAMREDQVRRLTDRLVPELPEAFAQIVERTARPQAQLIYTTELPAYRVGRQVVIGDAGTVTPPFTGSGVFKGFQNAAGLLETIEGLGKTLDEALASWSDKQVRLARRLSRLGAQMERALVFEPLDLASADAETTERWWNETVTFPAGFSHDATPSSAPPP